MKKLLLIFIILSTSRIITFSQALDNQWLVLDNNGKSGYNAITAENIFGNTNMGQKTKLWAVSHVEVDNPQVARNDIFVIFRNGNYFNSRDYNASSYKENFFIPQGSNEDSVNHYFYSINNNGIECLYLSNIYEDDDPPPYVRATNWTGTVTAPVDTFFNTTPVDILTANHTVAMEKDITLILKNSGSLAVNDTLFINKILSGTSVIYGEFFEISNVFSGREEFSNIAAENLGNGKIVLKEFSTDNPAYIFINLRPTEDLEDYAGSASAVFLLKHQNQSNPYASLTESIAFGHDPNFIQVKSICEKDNGEKYVSYHIQFENDGSIPAGKIKVTFDLPEYFYEECISETKFYIGGLQVIGSALRFNDHVEFVFNPNEIVLPCVSKDVTNCSGYVEFVLRARESVDLTDLTTTLKLKNPEVVFDHQAFPINHFYDIAWVADPDHPGRNSSRQPPDNFCTYSCLSEWEKNIEENQVIIYPNPGLDELFVSWNSQREETVDFILLDISGKVLFNQKLFSMAGVNKTKINTKLLDHGIYIVQLITTKSSLSSTWMKTN